MSMEKELLNTFDKELLIKDLSSRLPYNVIVDYSYNAFDLRKGNYVKHAKHGSKCILTCSLLDVFISPRQNEAGEYIKPYLFPLSSMTDKDLVEFFQIRGLNLNSDELKTFRRGITVIASTLPSYSRHIDWLNKNHFDYRGLIEKGLAIDATGLNIY